MHADDLERVDLLADPHRPDLGGHPAAGLDGEGGRRQQRGELARDGERRRGPGHRAEVEDAQRAVGDEGDGCTRGQAEHHHQQRRPAPDDDRAASPRKIGDGRDGLASIPEDRRRKVPDGQVDERDEMAQIGQ